MKQVYRQLFHSPPPSLRCPQLFTVAILANENAAGANELDAAAREARKAAHKLEAEAQKLKGGNGAPAEATPKTAFEAVKNAFVSSNG